MSTYVVRRDDTTVDMARKNWSQNIRRNLQAILCFFSTYALLGMHMDHIINDSFRCLPTYYTRTQNKQYKRHKFPLTAIPTPSLRVGDKCTTCLAASSLCPVQYNFHYVCFESIHSIPSISWLRKSIAPGLYMQMQISAIEESLCVAIPRSVYDWLAIPIHACTRWK